jgi:hypothetical protein
MLLIWYVNACNSGHSANLQQKSLAPHYLARKRGRILPLLVKINLHSALTLLMARVRADNAYHTLAPDNLAVAAQFLYRSTYFHI